ncbi:radical SAM protein [Thiolapillus sp.]|uniref:radical SAM protein n=1 Tax=Thiolapillus sp. TaxID=2017437 RepID=UPI003AF70642
MFQKNNMNSKLTTTDHSRDAAGLQYVYPVLSRRAGGLSVGINFNTNNACNWRCIYCQVPGLVRGSAPELDLALLEEELRVFLQDVLQGDFYERFQVPGELRQIRDIAISGNGEPTSSRQFSPAVDLIGRVMQEVLGQDACPFVLISNGSLMHRAEVQEGLQQLQGHGGQVWFKIDSATPEGRRLVNHAAISRQNVVDNLLLSAKLCPTWLQTCLIDLDDRDFMIRERRAYLQLLSEILEKTTLQGVLLYTLARPSQQPEAERLVKVPPEELHDFARQIRALDIPVKVSL